MEASNPEGKNLKIESLDNNEKYAYNFNCDDIYIF
jgi:hypothetical protein